MSTYPVNRLAIPKPKTSDDELTFNNLIDYSVGLVNKYTKNIHFIFFKQDILLIIFIFLVYFGILYYVGTFSVVIK